MKRSLSFLLFISTALFLFACKEKNNSAESEAARGEYTLERNFVDTVHLKYGDFSREILSNGLLSAVNKAELFFKTQGTVERLFVKNGDYVAKSDTIALLDLRAAKLALERAEQAMLKAEIDYKDNLIGMGYGRNTADIPEETKRIAQIHSGYMNAKNELEAVRLEYANSALVAPFGGLVANLEIKPYESVSDKSCTIIDNNSFNVTFKLLEAEIDYVKVGESVVVVPFIREDESYSGYIKSINPYVDENGQIEVTASIKNSDKRLIDGMNVKIYIKNLSHNKLAVPKTAVVIRDGLDVIFTLDTTSMKARWVYVDILESNSTHHVIRGNASRQSELHGGEIVITSGNLNLAEGSNVEIKL